MSQVMEKEVLAHYLCMESCMGCSAFFFVSHRQPLRKRSLAKQLIGSSYGKNKITEHSVWLSIPMTYFRHKYLGISGRGLVSKGQKKETASSLALKQCPANWSLLCHQEKMVNSFLPHTPTLRKPRRLTFSTGIEFDAQDRSSFLWKRTQILLVELDSCT